MRLHPRQVTWFEFDILNFLLHAEVVYNFSYY